MKLKDYLLIAIIAVVFTVAIAVIAGWILDVQILKSIVPGFVTMKFSTALAFFMSGLILLGLSGLIGKSGLNRILVYLFSIILLFFIGYILITFILGINSLIEIFFVADVAGSIMSVKPGVPSVATMVNFVLIALAGLFSFMKYKSQITKACGIIVGITGISSLLGYLLNKPILYFYFAGFSGAMAVHTAFIFVLIGVALYLLAGKALEEKGNFLSVRVATGFFVVIFLIILMVGLTSQINNLRLDKTNQIKDVESPLERMTELVIGYDAMLTGAAHESLLHAEQNDLAEMKENRAYYNEIGEKLDNLLKIEAPALLEKSTRSIENKNRTYELLKQLDFVNLKLVDLETKAFEAMEKGDTELAKSFIVSEKYEGYKKELADLYLSWANLEISITTSIRDSIIQDSSRLANLNFYFTFFILIIALVVSLIVSGSISKPIKKLNDSVDEISKGKLEARLEKSDILEVQGLTNSLNRILATMKLAILRTGLSKGELGFEEAIKQKEEAEQEVRESKNFLNSIIQNIPDMIFVKDAKDFKFEEMNHTGEKLLGLPREKIIGKTLFEKFSKSQSDFFLAKDKEVIKERKMLDIPEEFIDTPQGKRTLHTKKIPIYDEKGNPKYLLGISEDITDKNNAENRYKILYETSSDAIMTLESPTWKFTAGNPAALKLYGVKSEEEFRKLGPGDLSPEKQPNGKKSADEAKKMIEKAMKEGSAYFEWTHRRYDGDSFPATILLSRIKEGDKVYLQATVRDISEKKQLENKYRSLFDSSSDAIFIHDLAGNFLEVNEVAYKRLGYTKQELLNLGPAKIDASRFVKLVPKRIAELNKNGHAIFETAHMTKKGKEIPVEISSRVIEYEGKPAILSIARDIRRIRNFEK